MSEEFKVEIINPEKSFLLKEDVTEVIVPAFEGEMGILRDHISIISFLKPGIVKLLSKSGEENFYVEDGILEFKNNDLSILTSSIFNIKDVEKNKIQEIIKQAEKDSQIEGITDQNKYLSPVAAKHIETLQRSNEQLVKIISLRQKSNPESLELTEKDKENLFDLIQGGES